MGVLADVICLATLEVLMGMCCQLISQSRCALATAKDMAGTSTELHLYSSTDRVVCMVLRRCGYGGRVCELWRNECRVDVDCPVYTAGNISRVVRAAIHGAGSCPSFRTGCTHLCHTFTRRYRVEDVAAAIAGLLGTAWSANMSESGNRIQCVVGGYSLCFVSGRVAVSHRNSSRAASMNFSKGVRLSNGQLIHKLDKLASDEFFRLVCFAASVCTSICIRQIRI